jgi:biotin carboxyl carrier protein
MNIHVKIGDQIFEVEVGDLSVRPIQVKVDCDTYEVWPTIEVPNVQMAVEEKSSVYPGTPRPAVAVVSAWNNDKKRVVSAPIPGTIIAISTMPGMNVKPGQELCLLEAMKMKNAICATRTGTVAAVLVSVNDQVQKGQALVEYTD